MDMCFEELEKTRLILQNKLDAQKSSAQRNQLGQFATPTALARDILTYAYELMPPGELVRFLDPAIGTGSFYSALRIKFPSDRIASATGFELDAHYANPAKLLWQNLDLKIHVADFTTQLGSQNHNLVICNPPYVRHHHLPMAEKLRLQYRSLESCGQIFSGLAGLYCYFLGIAHSWMAERALACWLIPSEFMDVNYGIAIKRYLLERVSLLRIHRFDPNDVQFTDALVSSAVVWFRNERPAADRDIEFSFGGTLSNPSVSRVIKSAALATETKWTRFPRAEARIASAHPTISDFFKIKRGIATGNNRYFILSEQEIARRGLPIQAFKSILPSPRNLPMDEVPADPSGDPLIEKRLFLMDTKMSEIEIETRFPALLAYLQEGKTHGVNLGYLCRNRPVWYAQENRPAAPLVCTYLGRADSAKKKPFRFILNHSRATVANVYLAMYPTPILAKAIEADDQLIRKIWEILNGIDPSQLLDEGRVYGGGLHKLEPKELAKVPVPDIAKLIPNFNFSRQAKLFDSP